MTCYTNEDPPGEHDLGEEYGVASDGTRLHLDVHKPGGQGPWPAVLVVHGGGWKAGYRQLMRATANALAAEGFVGCPVDYRLAPPNVLCLDGGNGKPEEPCTQANQPVSVTFDGPILDLRLAVTYMRTQSYVLGNPNGKVGILGVSAGGNLALFTAGTGVVGTTRPDCAVGISGYPDFTVANPNPFSQESADNYAGGSTEAQRRAASPYYNVDATAKPMYVANSEFDGLSPVASTRNFHAKLLSLGVTHTYKEYTGEGGHWEPTLGKCWTEVVAFLHAHLG